METQHNIYIYTIYMGDAIYQKNADFIK